MESTFVTNSAGNLAIALLLFAEQLAAGAAAGDGALIQAACQLIK